MNRKRVLENKRLSPEDREFLSLVKRAAVANPFGCEREMLDVEIARTNAACGADQRINKTLMAVQARMTALEGSKGLSIQEYGGTDKNLVEFGYWFLVFYKYRKKFDMLIREQLKADKKPGLLQTSPVKVSFASEALDFLENRGFSQEHAQRFFELCYQLRRAYFFIKQTLAGTGPSMRKLRHDLWCGVFTQNIELYSYYLWDRMEEFSTLILGETGTGKGTAAAAIGRSGHIPFDIKKQRFAESFSKLFLAVNLSGFAETLIESELFGYKKGAFTGAMENYSGVFSRCSPHGSILLDEIGELPGRLQIKLLQVFQERFFYPVGSHKEERFHGRVIAATNRPLEALRNKGGFRDDFYYRLCSDIIVVPPLRQRIQEEPAELDGLIGHLVRRMLGRSSPEIAGMVRRVIDSQLGPEYPWHGNVRELEQCVRRVLLRNSYAGGGFAVREDLGGRLGELLKAGEITAHELVGGYCKLLRQRLGTYEEVARRAGLDRRTVAKYIREWDHGETGEEDALEEE
jgi:hypothetical protein